jgi:hypothetical protein
MNWTDAAQSAVEQRASKEVPVKMHVSTRWTYYPLSDGDQKAKEQVLKNLEMGAHEHTLSRRLLARFSEARGSMLLIAFDSLDRGADGLYEYATYCGGKSKPPDLERISWMDCPRWGLVPLLDKYLLKAKQALVLCENWAATRKAVAEWPRQPRVLLYGDEVYHVLTSDNGGSPESIECAIRESEHQWATGVCSSCAEVPQGEIPSETFLDDVVARAAHIFTPALDGEGYLVWSPVLSKQQDGGKEP